MYFWRKIRRDMAKIIGREKEMQTLAESMKSERSEFVAVYGRRRWRYQQLQQFVAFVRPWQSCTDRPCDRAWRQNHQPLRNEVLVFAIYHWQGLRDAASRAYGAFRQSDTHQVWHTYNLGDNLRSRLQQPLSQYCKFRGVSWRLVHRKLWQLDFNRSKNVRL